MELQPVEKHQEKSEHQKYQVALIYILDLVLKISQRILNQIQQTLLIRMLQSIGSGMIQRSLHMDRYSGSYHTYKSNTSVNRRKVGGFFTSPLQIDWMLKN